MSRVILISGASRGIGKAIAEKFALSGDSVVINYFQSEDRATALEKNLKDKGCKVITCRCDVSVWTDVEKMVELVHKTFGKIDVLINNAGVDLYKIFQDSSDTDCRKLFDTNVFGVFNCSRAVVPDMIDKKCGKIVNISSCWGVCGASMETIYSSSKAAVIGFTKALSKELAPSNINVNAIAPGVIDTEMNDRFSLNEKKEIEKEIPFGRFGKAEEIAELVYFLCGKESAYITGQCIGADGGYI